MGLFNAIAETQHSKNEPPANEEEEEENSVNGNDKTEVHHRHDSGWRKDALRYTTLLL